MGLRRRTLRAGAAAARRFLSRAAAILALEDQYKALTDQQLRQAAADIKDVFRRQRETPIQRDHAFAIVREAAFRQRGERPFLVQVAGSGHRERVRGRNGHRRGQDPHRHPAGHHRRLAGLGCHIITVNDYLAKRDAEWMAAIYNFCGVSVSSIQRDHAPPSAERRTRPTSPMPPTRK